MITRRTLVGSIISITTGTLAGCASDESAVTESDGTEQSPGIAKGSTDQSGTSENSESGQFEQFETAVVDLGITVVDGSYDASERVAKISYVPQSGNENALADEIGSISGTFFRHVEDGWAANRLVGRILDTDESPTAEWYARVEWYEAYQEDDMTAEELSTQVLDTVTSV